MQLNCGVHFNQRVLDSVIQTEHQSGVSQILRRGMYLVHQAHGHHIPRVKTERQLQIVITIRDVVVAQVDSSSECEQAAIVLIAHVLVDDFVEEEERLLLAIHRVQTRNAW